MDKESIKSGYVALIGVPNVGKSSILNAFVGQKISIVSPKAQTTRKVIMGILTKGQTQLVFIDTPGVHKSKNHLDKFMNKVIQQSIDSVDLILIVVDANKKIGKLEKDIIEQINVKNIAAILALNKIDLIKNKSVLFEIMRQYSDLADFKAIVPVSATKKDGLDELFGELEKNIPEGEHFFDEDEFTDQTERALVAEIIREKILKCLDKEIPHGVAVFIEKMKYRRTRKIVDIDAVIYCEKMSHKGIIIGSQGTKLKKIGSEARHDIESLLGNKANLALWVKVKEGWKDNPGILKDLGYNG